MVEAAKAGQSVRVIFRTVNDFRCPNCGRVSHYWIFEGTAEEAEELHAQIQTVEMLVNGGLKQVDLALTDYDDRILCPHCGR